MAHKDIIVFTDNSSVKEGLVTGVSKSLALRDLLLLVAKLIVKLQGRMWIATILSKSNPPDGPRRGRTTELDAWADVQRITPKWPNPPQMRHSPLPRHGA